MILKIFKKFSYQCRNKTIFRLYIRNASNGFADFKHEELTTELKHDIERHWRNKLVEKKFDPSNIEDKFYVLSMFPYPSGNLHMGHVRVYTISDAMARFYRMNGKNVLHPMGWDAFGLPAENAANQRNIPADVWTKENIAQMKEQLINLGCSFDWDRELTTCDPSYYKWTQSLFLKLFKAGMAYQKEALVNWDPVDKTVLADEQVDETGHSWRSGAKVEKKFLRQWFVKATKFSKSLYDGLSDLDDWKDIINLQKHWIGECDGFTFDFPVENGDYINVWTKTPEYFETAAFIAIRNDHALNKDKISQGISNLHVKNPFTGKMLPVVVADDVVYAPHRDTYLGLPSVNKVDKEFAVRHHIQIPDNTVTDDLDQLRQKILLKAQTLNIGGYASSSKLKDWLISRQRNWGTPIPIIHCNDCGVVPVNESDLPVLHSSKTSSDQLKTTCPKCNNPNAQRESDTMDTFVDSSWYFLRFLDSKNDTKMFDESLSRFMPVDLYIGGKEHAVLHLYYARFVNHFLHSIGLVPEPEPFKRLLVQGMVKGRSFRVKSTGQYVKESDVKIDEEQNKAEELSTGQPVIMEWEKMSKSKYNGVSPADVIAELSCDSVRLIMLGDVAPTSDRNWSPATFPGILSWQNRLWLTVNQFHNIRCDDSISKERTKDVSFAENDAKLFEARNHYLKNIHFNYKFSHQLSVAVTYMQALTKVIRRAPKEVIKYSAEYERSLASLIMVLAPMAPHFTSELWSRFIRVPNRINECSNAINWELDVLQQTWPKIDINHALELRFLVNAFPRGVQTFTQDKFKNIDLQQALQYALEHPEVKKRVRDKKIERSSYVYYSECWGIVNLFTGHSNKQQKRVVEQ